MQAQEETPMQTSLNHGNAIYLYFWWPDFEAMTLTVMAQTIKTNISLANQVLLTDISSISLLHFQLYYYFIREGERESRGQ